MGVCVGRKSAAVLGMIPLGVCAVIDERHLGPSLGGVIGIIAAGGQTDGAREGDAW